MQCSLRRRPPQPWLSRLLCVAVVAAAAVRLPAPHPPSPRSGAPPPLALALSLPPVPRRRPLSLLRRLLPDAAAAHLAPAALARSASLGYRLRLSADPSFPAKSAAEVLLAAGTQLAAELNWRGGPAGVARELDFVVAGVLTAVAGKYYSMWRVAPTASVGGDEAARVAVASASVDEEGTASAVAVAVPSGRGRWDDVPTNAFQPYLLDGVTRPTPAQRLMAIVAPVPSLFRAGFVASAFGYGLTSAFIRARSALLPGYVAATAEVNVLHACLFTGCFLAVASNLRYQILQGLVEPYLVDKVFRRVPLLRAAATFLVRLGNGLLGSVLAIMGMRWLGLQRLRE